MGNEREAFEAWCEDTGYYSQLSSLADAFQAGAAYQREQDKKLVEALVALIKDYDGEIHNEYDGTSKLDSRLSEINYAREALADWLEATKL